MGGRVRQPRVGIPDYYCRFFYVHRRNDYLSPWHPRDVIETPLDDTLDVNG